MLKKALKFKTYKKRPPQKSGSQPCRPVETPALFAGLYLDIIL
jgi:hypothetical protein